MEDQKEPTPGDAEEDTLVLVFEDGTTEDVILPAGTIAKLEKKAEAEGKVFGEDYLREIILGWSEQVKNSTEPSAAETTETAITETE